MQKTFTVQSLLRRHIAVPSDHGAWVFLLSPLIIGLVAGGWRSASFLLVGAALAGFLLRQPITTAVKVYSGRRPADELGAAYFWIGVYVLAAVAAVADLIWQGAGYLFYLALPALPVFIWHLALVSRRAERRQLGVELVGSGVLALAAPAAYWLGIGSPDSRGWLLWLLAWAQSAASIVYAYLRLEQRLLRQAPDLVQRWRMAERAIFFCGANLLVVGGLAGAGLVSLGLVLPFLLQLAETIYGALRPAVGVKPVFIGLRQLIVSSLFTLVFVLAWH